jgi:hypothetical protein
MLLLKLLLWLHPFFLSVYEVAYIKADNAVGISCKIFPDDLENTLKKSTGRNVDIIGGNKAANISLLTSYFSKHLQIRVNDKDQTFTVVGYEPEGEAIFVYLECKDTGEPRKLEFITDMLYELDRSQINLIHFIHKGERRTQRLTYPDTKAVFEIK